MNWRDNPKISDFLARVESFTEQYNVIEMGGVTEKLYHCFWSLEEIGKAESHKSDWEVHDWFVPFYGDWHNLFCLDTSSSPPSIISINDQREVLHRWITVNEFLASLKQVAEEPVSDDDLGIIEEGTWLNI